MVELSLTEEESKIMVFVLESYLSDLRMEISDTDRMDFRNHLKERKEVLAKIVSTLKDAAPA